MARNYAKEYSKGKISREEANRGLESQGADYRIGGGSKKDSGGSRHSSSHSSHSSHSSGGLTNAQKQMVQGWKDYVTQGYITQSEADRHISDIYGKAGMSYQSGDSPSYSGGTTGGQPIGSPPSGYTEYIAPDQQYMSQSELAAIQSYRDQAKRGEITWDQAHQKAENDRSKYGYSVDKTGKQTVWDVKQDPYEATPFENYARSIGYDEYAEATQRAIQAAVDRAVSQSRSQMEGVEDDADEAARRAYVAKMMGQRNLDQELAAGGYSGGMADQAKIMQETAYQQNLLSIEQEKQLAIRELEQAISQAKFAGDLRTAQELQAYVQQLQGQWQNYMMNKEQMQNQNYWQQQEFDRQQQQDAATRAMVLLQLGIMPGEDMLTQANIPLQIAQQVQGQYQAPTRTGQSVQYNAAPQHSKPQSTTVAPSNKEPDQSKFGGDVISRLNILASESSPEVTMEYVDKKWPYLTNDEKQQVQKLLARYGWTYQ